MPDNQSYVFILLHPPVEQLPLFLQPAAISKSPEVHVEQLIYLLNVQS